MQHSHQAPLAGRHTRFAELLPVRQFVHDLAAVILADGNQFEGVWSITNRVYDRWMDESRNLPGKTSPHPEPDLALSA